MKADIKYKLLQHINQKKTNKEEGFTLIELLVVIIIIGILAAIALPSFLNQANKAKQTEAKQTLSAMGKSQQAYYTENNTFLKTMTDFAKYSGAGVKTATVNYTYDVQAADPNVVNLAKPPVNGALLAYAGGVGLVEPVGGGDKTSTTTLCQSTKAGVTPAANAITFTANDVKCPGTDYVDAK
jgi:prepilin-type N-terminal cleavage/methylation domain-containing protein